LSLTQYLIYASRKYIRNNGGGMDISVFIANCGTGGKDISRLTPFSLPLSLSGGRTGKPAGTLAHVEESFAQPEERLAHVEEPFAHAEERLAHVKESFAHAEERLAHVKESFAHAEERLAHAEEAFAHAEERLAHVEEAFAHAEEGLHMRRRHLHILGRTCTRRGGTI
jgi:hypothetical protein